MAHDCESAMGRNATCGDLSGGAAATELVSAGSVCTSGWLRGPVATGSACVCHLGKAPVAAGSGCTSRLPGGAVVAGVPASAAAAGGINGVRRAVKASSPPQSVQPAGERTLARPALPEGSTTSAPGMVISGAISAPGRMAMGHGLEVGPGGWGAGRLRGRGIGGIVPGAASETSAIIFEAGTEGSATG